ncbi:hypothetical protein CDCA_CDCA05G1542 [Cyanidium caldarium]|uniref:Uncharacterized protein n=1 Tax=Cyanidium caldarium TaxID=2771 RepID=A0AAV9IT67_CYACA|nr:hypothetical protein CDCA_CDCA05G1542 [Cyanidium caldarium]
MQHRQVSFAHRLLLLLFVGLCLFGRASVTGQQVPGPPADRRSALAAHRGRSESGLIPVRHASSLEKFVLSGPRDYAVVLLLSTASQPGACPLCDYVVRQLMPVARAVKRQNERLAGRGQLQVFFLLADVGAANQREMIAALSRLGVNVLPTLLYVPPGDGGDSAVSSTVPFRFEAPPKGDGLDGRAMAAWLLRLANQAVPTDRRAPPLRITIGGPVYVVPAVRRHWRLCAATLASAVTAALYSGLHRRRYTWLALVLLLYMFVVGGGHGWIINGTPLFMWDGERLVWSMGSTSRMKGPSGPNALAAEGFLEVTKYVVIAALMVALDKLPRRAPRGWSQVAVAAPMLALLTSLLRAVLVDVRQ